MLPLCSYDSWLLLPALTVYFMCICDVCAYTQKPCALQNKYLVIIRNIGITLCQVKCIENGICFNIEYSNEKLICRLSGSKKIKEREGYIVLPKNHSHKVWSGSCVAKSCNLISRCLETRVGKVVCVKRGTQTHRLHKSRESILHDACRQGCLNRIKRILSDGRVDVNNRDAKDGMTPSMLAAFLGYKHVFDLLVSNGGDLSLVDNNGDNLLQAACHGGSLDIIKYVLPLGIVDINSRDRYGRTPLMMAIFDGHRDVYDLLLSKGADASLVDNYHDKTVHIACITGHVGMMKYVISQNTANINTRGHYGRTPVMIAAEYGHREAFDLLVSIGADMSLVDNNSDKILHVACFGGHVEMVEYVLSQNTAAINTRGHFGRTPVMIAAEYGHREAFDLLVHKGADVFLVDDSNDTILHVACFGGHVEMVQYLLSKITVDINCKGNYGRTPVMVAAEKGHRKTFDLLVKQGADVSLVDDNGHNILHLASLAGRVQMVTYLISHEYVDINGKNKFGYTAAMIAANEKHKAVFDILVSKSNV